MRILDEYQFLLHYKQVPTFPLPSLRLVRALQLLRFKVSYPNKNHLYQFQDPEFSRFVYMGTPILAMARINLSLANLCSQRIKHKQGKTLPRKHRATSRRRHHLRAEDLFSLIVSPVVVRTLLLRRVF